MGYLRQSLIFFMLWVGLGGEERAFGISTDPLSGALSELQRFMASDVVREVVTTFGMVLDHRPLEPATPLGTHIGLDFGIEIDLVQIPSSFGSTLSAQGIDIPSIPVLPSLRELNLHKGLNDTMDFGFSLLSYRGYTVWALEMKVAVFTPEEGPTWAIRLSRTAVNFPIGSATVMDSNLAISLSTVTWTPQLVVSRKLDFSDPYIGIGYQYVTGDVNVSGNLNVPDVPGVVIPDVGSKGSTGGGGVAFIGLSLRPPNIGLRLTLEGGYSTAGYNYIGSKVGFSF